MRKCMTHFVTAMNFSTTNRIYMRLEHEIATITTTKKIKILTIKRARFAS